MIRTGTAPVTVNSENAAGTILCAPCRFPFVSAKNRPCPFCFTSAAESFSRSAGEEGTLLRLVFCILTAILILGTASAIAASLPADLTIIEDEAFYGVSMTELIIPDGVTFIGAHAFSAAALRHVTLPASVAYIHPTAFDGTAAGFFVTVTAGTYAETWCLKYGVSYAYAAPLYSVPTVTAETVSLQGEKYLGTPYSEMDCQAFVEACLRDAGIDVDLAGSNAWYRLMDWTGTPEECMALFGCIPKGAFLYILEFDGNEPDKYKADGIGNASHIGVYTGLYTKGHKGAMASSKSKGGVIHSYFAGETINGGWNRVGLWKELNYGETVNRLLQTR